MPRKQQGSAKFACFPSSNGSRLYQITEDRRRSPYQRDCDRIVHAKAFRRLMHKTQVFVSPDGDHFRTRLTHTIEVARVARSLAAALRLDVDLAESVALAHDLGHPPFGHSGEEALSELMREFGGFEHNAQAIRIVTKLERQYIDHDGLNLTWHTLEGIAKHNGPVSGAIPFALAEYNRIQDLNLELRAAGEAQAAAAADDVAYICHDLQDGIAAGMFELDDIATLPIAGPILIKVMAENPGVEDDRVITTLLRGIFKSLTSDIIRNSEQNLFELAPGSADDIRSHDRNIIGFSGEIRTSLAEIRRFLKENMYRTGDVEMERQRGKTVINSLFARLMNDIDLLPSDWRAEADSASTDARKARVLADFIAGMTDNFATGMYRRLEGREGRSVA